MSTLTGNGLQENSTSNRLQSWRRVGICLGLQAPVGICRDLPVFVGICGDLQGSVWPHTLRHSAIWLWGLASSPVLQPLAPGKILSRTGRTTIRSPSSSYPQDGRTAPLRTLRANPFFLLPPRLSLEKSFPHHCRHRIDSQLENPIGPRLLPSITSAC